MLLRKSKAIAGVFAVVLGGPALEAIGADDASPKVVSITVRDGDSLEITVPEGWEAGPKRFSRGTDHYAAPKKPGSGIENDTDSRHEGCAEHEGTLGKSGESCEPAIRKRVRRERM